MRRKGFTLIELMVVILIVAILAAVLAGLAWAFWPRPLAVETEIIALRDISPTSKPGSATLPSMPLITSLPSLPCSCIELAATLSSSSLSTSRVSLNASSIACGIGAALSPACSSPSHS